MTNVAVRRTDKEKESVISYGKYDPSGRREWDHHDSSGGPGRNETAIRLYERQGFVRDGLRKGILYRSHRGCCSYDPPQFLNRLTRRGTCLYGISMLNFATEMQEKEKYVRCLFTWLRRNDALPRRWLTALMTRYNGSSLMIDCGEGTQVAIKEKGLEL